MTRTACFQTISHACSVVSREILCIFNCYQPRIGRGAAAGPSQDTERQRPAVGLAPPLPTKTGGDWLSVALTPPRCHGDG